MNKSELARNFLLWYFSLPTIKRWVGVTSKYSTGIVRHIDFVGECTVVWVEYATVTKAFAYK